MCNVDRLVTRGYRQHDRLARRRRELLHRRPRNGGEVALGRGEHPEPHHAPPEAERLRAVGALEEAVRLERRREARRGALVHGEPRGEIGHAQLASVGLERPQDLERAVDALHRRGLRIAHQCLLLRNTWILSSRC